ncbi:type II secretion system F family protein [bacterium]|nr:type II secretion system F family protein [bacterium]
MANYRYKAKRGPGDVVEGVIDADSQAMALNKLSAMGYFPLSVTMESNRQSSGGGGTRFTLSFMRRVTIREIGSFTRQLADLLDSGVPLFKAVHLLYTQETSPSFKKVLEEVHASIKDGKTLHESLERHPRVFSELYVSMVKSGEIGGMLETVLERLADFAEQEDELRSKIKTAMTYPLFMAGVGAVSVLFLMIFVVPKLTQLFTDMGQQLPIPTQIMIAISTAITDYWWIVGSVILVVVYLFKRWKNTEEGGYLFDKLRLKVPVVKDLIMKEEIARFGRTLSTLLNNGVPIIQSLKIIVNTVKNRVLKREINDSIDDVSKGMKLGEYLRRSELFPPLFVNMVAIGEESGNIERSLEKVAESYDKQVDRTIKAFTSLLEPLMIVVLGIILGSIVVSMILPIFELSNVAQ